jgi:GDPmannose 4,6-dehydratase
MIIEGMYLILQQEKPEDFVLATGITTTVREFVRKSFFELGIEVVFEGSNEKEVAKVLKCNGPEILEIGSIVVEVDPKYYRPTEVDLLIGDATKAKEKLGWTTKYNLDELVNEMVNSDYNKLKYKINKNV